MGLPNRLPPTGQAASRSLQLRPRAEEAGVVGHVEHGRVFHRPRLYRLARRAINQDREAVVDRGGQCGVAAGPEDRRGAGVRIDAGEVLSRQRKTAFGIVEFGDTVTIKLRIVPARHLAMGLRPRHRI